jgi:hypothetical protein
VAQALVPLAVLAAVAVALGRDVLRLRLRPGGGPVGVRPSASGERARSDHGGQGNHAPALAACRLGSLEDLEADVVEAIGRRGLIVPAGRPVPEAPRSPR